MVTVLPIEVSDSLVLNNTKLFFLSGRNSQYQQYHMVQLNAFHLDLRGRCFSSLVLWVGGLTSTLKSEDLPRVHHTVNQVPWCSAWAFNSFTFLRHISKAQ